MKTALVVIDVQRGLCEGERPAFEAQQVIERINRVAAQARAAGALVIFVQHEAATELQYGTDAWQLARGLEVMPGDLHVRKTTCDSFHRTDLEQILKQRAVTRLVICGMHTEFCVDTTVRRALALGYEVVLIADAHTTEDRPHLAAAQIIRHHNETLANIESFGVRARVVSAGRAHFKD
ncbi:MAG: cysteine hydrolase family protein [Gemmatimonadota bacterium]